MGKSLQKRLKIIRIRLWHEDKRCRNCGIETILPNGKSQYNNTATIQHIYDKLDPRRKNSVEDVTLFCFKCNTEDNKIKTALYEVKELIEYNSVKAIAQKTEKIVTRYNVYPKTIGNKVTPNIGYIQANRFVPNLQGFLSVNITPEFLQDISVLINRCQKQLNKFLT